MAFRAFIITAFLLLIPFKSVQGQQIIHDREHLFKWLYDTHNESRRIIAKISSGHVLEILVSPEGTFTVLITNPEGITMLVNAGTDWKEFDLKTIVPKKPEIEL